MRRIEQGLRVCHGLAIGNQETGLLDRVPELHCLGGGLLSLVRHPNLCLGDAKDGPGLRENQGLRICARGLVPA